MAEGRSHASARIMALIGCLALAAALIAGCGDDEEKDSAGDRELSSSFYVADNLAPEIDQLATEIGINTKVEMTIEQGSVEVTYRNGGELVTQKVTAGDGDGAADISNETSDQPVNGPILNDIDPETVQQLADEVSKKLDVEQDNITSISTAAPTGGSEAFRWVIEIDDGSSWESFLDGSDLAEA